MKPNHRLHAFYHLIFWLWNFTFLTIAYGVLLPIMGVWFFEEVLAGQVPPTLALSLMGLLVVPTVCTGAGIALRQDPVKLMRLFYGVEAPLVTLCIFRLFIIRELTPASSQILGTVLVCIGVFAIELLVGFVARRRSLAWLQVAGHSLLLIIGTYLGVLLTFYTVPALCVFLYNLLKFEWLGVFWNSFIVNPIATVWWLPVFMLLFGVSCTLFFAMPFAMISLYSHSWWRVFSAFGERYGVNKAIASTVSVAIAWCLVFSLLQQQPQVQAFQLLAQPAQTPQARRELIAKSDVIRDGLVNAYLHSYRYLGSWVESNQLREMYMAVFGLSQPQAQFWQDFHNHWISPFLYNGDRTDGEKAAHLYAQFFDAPIQRAERAAIQHALQSTSNRDETKAGLLNINQEVVRLAQQQVNVTEQGDWAEVELYEQYENPTFEDQEIFYSFSLPESAVVTGVWLGTNGDRSQRFPFVVSPRGAAQQVYNGEVERATIMVAEDPALLEQVGPQQYRLRVFPIPAQITNTPGQLHLWMTYKVMQQPDGWALPHLSEKRNVFWNSKTVRQRNGHSTNLPTEDWLEASLPTSHQTPTLHQTAIEGYQITARPLKAEEYALPHDKRFALVLDSSRSMANHTRELRETFDWLTQQGTQNDVDLYVAVANGAEPQRINDIQGFDATKTPFYGSLQLDQIVWQFAQLREQTAYDAVLLLTDEGSYELSQDEVDLPDTLPPLWLVHLGGKLPHAYADQVLQAVQDGRGGVAGDVAEAMQRLATEAQLGQTIASVTDGYAWSVEPVTTDATPPSTDAAFAPLAARQLILKLSRQHDMTQLAALDQVHAIAKTTKIVTPYSSMLVLVNDRQRELLREAEASGDRFSREVENGQDELTEPNNPLNVASVPEPSNVLGMGVVAIALLVLAKRRPADPKSGRLRQIR
ncbi:MAG: TIGR02921 family PEP-CTERM protein [Oculatellaceae cyanobacterium bins.114]|nr:TIGR02921 family PEP-CTERM protein [Oculatellaceae cyanobacterium bins.114]